VSLPFLCFEEVEILDGEEGEEEGGGVFLSLPFFGCLSLGVGVGVVGGFEDCFLEDLDCLGVLWVVREFPDSEELEDSGSDGGGVDSCLTGFECLVGLVTGFLSLEAD
jgi:hypothetical protein